MLSSMVYSSVNIFLNFVLFYISVLTDSISISVAN
jgi:hypothetical protein